MFRIRPAVIEDAEVIASVHVASWRTTYRGLLPQSVLDDLSVESRAKNWRGLMSAKYDQGFVYVAELLDPSENPGKIVGFASGGFERTENKIYDGELYSIYMLQEAQRQGIGKALAVTVARRLLADGYQGMLVWVLKENPARKFYEALGGEYVTEQAISIGPANAVEVAYGWKDIRTIPNIDDIHAV